MTAQHNTKHASDCSLFMRAGITCRPRSPGHACMTSTSDPEDPPLARRGAASRPGILGKRNCDLKIDATTRELVLEQGMGHKVPESARTFCTVPRRRQMQRTIHGRNEALTPNDEIVAFPGGNVIGAMPLRAKVHQAPTQNVLVLIHHLPMSCAAHHPTERQACACEPPARPQQQHNS